MKQLTEEELLHRAAAYCSGVERCRQDVEKKIAAAGLPPEATARIIQRLVDERFIDEARFCRSFVNDKLRFNKWGRIRIGYELRQRQIPKALIAEALEAIDEAAYREILKTLLKDKRRSVKAKDKRDLFSKLLRFAAGRGFESESIIKCLQELGDYEELDQEDWG